MWRMENGNRVLTTHFGAHGQKNAVHGHAMDSEWTANGQRMDSEWTANGHCSHGSLGFIFVHF